MLANRLQQFLLGQDFNLFGLLDGGSAIGD